MTKGEALYTFYSSFDIPAYPTTAVPDDVTFPYMIYEPFEDAFGGGDVSVSVDIYYYTASEKEPSEKARELAERLAPIGVTLACDEGYIWIKRGTPFCQSIADDSDLTIKRRHINLEIEFLTNA